MPEKKPTVSVIIPTYNRAHLISRAIKSVLNQTYQDFEVIVVDDGSTDNTEKIVKSFNDSRIRYIRHEMNRGGAAARNTGIKAARGEYIAFLDSDDEWLPEKLRRQVEYLESSDEKVGVVYCSQYLQDDSTNTVGEPGGDLYTGNVYKYLLRGWCPPTTSLFLVKYRLLTEVGFFDPSLPSFQDYDLWLRLAQICYFGAVEAPLVIKHTHPGIQIAKDPSIRYKALNIFMEKWGPIVRKEVGDEVAAKLRLKFLSQIYANAMVIAISQGKRRAAISSFLQYMRITRGVHLKSVAKLLIGIIGGTAGYKFAKKSWSQWKQRKKRGK